MFNLLKLTAKLLLKYLQTRYWLSKPICILELENRCLHQILSQSRSTTSSAPGSLLTFPWTKKLAFVPPAACDNHHHLLKRGVLRPICLPHTTDQVCWPCSAAATDVNSLGRRTPCHPASSNVPLRDALCVPRAFWSLPACFGHLPLVFWFIIYCAIFQILFCAHSSLGKPHIIIASNPPSHNYSSH